MTFLNTKTIKISDVSFEDSTPYYQTQSLSGKYQKRVAGPQFFKLEFTANYMADDINEVKRFIAQYKFSTPFQLPLSYFSKYTGSATGTPLVSNGVSKGTRLIPLSGFSGTLGAGTVIQFANHTKLYTITDDVAANGTAKIFPALYQDIQLGEAVAYTDIKGSFVLTNDSFKFPITQIGNIKFTAVEYIQ